MRGLAHGEMMKEKDSLTYDLFFCLYSSKFHRFKIFQVFGFSVIINEVE